MNGYIESEKNRIQIREIVEFFFEGVLKNDNAQSAHNRFSKGYDIFD